MPTLIFTITEEEYQRDQQRLAQLEKKLAMLEACLEQSSTLVKSDEARQLTGIKDNRTLKKRFEPVEDNGVYKYRRSDLVKWRLEQGLPKDSLK